MKKLLTLIIVLCMVIALGACGAKEPATTPSEAPVQEVESEPAERSYSIGMSVADISNVTWAAQIDEITRQCDELGWTITAVQHDNDVAKLVTHIENFISADVDFLVLQTTDGEAVKDLLLQAKEKGICIIGDGTPIDIADMNYVNDNYDAGFLGGVALGNWFNEVYGEEHEAVIAQMLFDHELCWARTNGQLEGLASVHPNYKVVAEGYPYDAASAMTETENMLTAHPEIEAITNWGDSMAIGCLEAARGMGKTADDFAVISIDGTQEALAEIKAGSSFIETTSLGGPAEQGADMIKMIKAFIEGNYENTYYSPNIAIVRSNVDDYIK